MAKATGLTHNQQIVFDVLSHADRPQTAYEILGSELAHENGLKAPLTIYRALEALVDKALVHRIESLNAFIACDHEPHPEPAAFLICRNCRKTHETTMEACSGIFQATARQQLFTVEQVTIEMSGLCAECQAQARS
ncbi:MAG: transcriptional repressor [Hyphomicrobiales bacterium]|nr:MAG: transcriptional repressor [Hyphomicrobiales bacterium]